MREKLCFGRPTTVVAGALMLAAALAPRTALASHIRPGTTIAACVASGSSASSCTAGTAASSGQINWHHARHSSHHRRYRPSHHRSTRTYAYRTHTVHLTHTSAHGIRSTHITHSLSHTARPASHVTHQSATALQLPPYIPIVAPASSGADAVDLPGLAIKFVIVLVLLLACLRVLRALLPRLTGGTNAAARGMVLHSEAIGAKNHIQILDLGVRILVVASAGTAMTPLTTIDDPEEMAALRNRYNPTPVPAASRDADAPASRPSFAQALRATMQTMRGPDTTPPASIATTAGEAPASELAAHPALPAAPAPRASDGAGAMPRRDSGRSSTVDERTKESKKARRRTGIAALLLGSGAGKSRARKEAAKAPAGARGAAVRPPATALLTAGRPSRAGDEGAIFSEATASLRALRRRMENA